MRCQRHARGAALASARDGLGYASTGTAVANWRASARASRRPDAPPLVFLIGGNGEDDATPEEWAAVVEANRAEWLRGMVFTWAGSVDATLADARGRKAARAGG